MQVLLGYLLPVKKKTTKIEFDSDFTSQGTSGFYLPSSILYHCCFELQFPSRSARSQILNCKLVPRPLVYSQSEQTYKRKEISLQHQFGGNLKPRLASITLEKLKT